MLMYGKTIHQYCKVKNNNNHNNSAQFVVIHRVKGFDVIIQAKVDVFLELSCFFDDPVDVGNLISGF